MTLSLCMIVKNEQDVLERCLLSAKDVFDQIIIVDTGSSDNTIKIAEKYADIVSHFDWQDDFSAARNYSFSLASTDYIMWLDADDVLSPENRLALIQLKSSLNGSADAYFLRYDAAFDEYGNVSLFYYRERIFKRLSGFVWEGEIHEAVSVYGNLVYSDIAITHLRQTKQERNFRNLLFFLKGFLNGKTPDARGQFYFARELVDHGLYNLAASVFTSFLSNENGWSENKICACRDLAFCYKMLGNRDKRRQALFLSFSFGSPRPDICCDIGEFYFEIQDFKHAIFWYKLAANEPQNGQNGAFVVPDYYGFIPYMWLCVCFDKLGNFEKARFYNDLAGKIKPYDKNYLHNKLYFDSFMNKG